MCETIPPLVPFNIKERMSKAKALKIVEEQAKKKFCPILGKKCMGSQCSSYMLKNLGDMQFVRREKRGFFKDDKLFYHFKEYLQAYCILLKAKLSEQILIREYDKWWHSGGIL